MCGFKWVEAGGNNNWFLEIMEMGREAVCLDLDKWRLFSGFGKIHTLHQRWEITKGLMFQTSHHFSSKQTDKTEFGSCFLLVKAVFCEKLILN